MKTLRKVSIEPVFVTLMPSLYERGKIYISKEYKVAKHLCLCGCDNMTVMPLDDGAKWWKLVEEPDGSVSFIGSVGNYNFPCRSHYIITKNVANFV